MDLERRVKIAKRKSEGRNCLGTAFFISSVFSDDGYYNTKLAYQEVLRYLVPLKRAEVGAIIVLHKVDPETGSNEAVHAGVVTSINQVRIVHRTGTDRELICEEDLDRFRSYLIWDRRNYPDFKHSLRYYSSIPKELEPFL